MTDLTIASTNPPPLFDVRGALTTLWRRRILVVLVTLAAVMVSGLYVVTTKPSFTAQAAILVDPRDVRSTNIDSVLPGIGADSAAIASQVSVIESRALLAQVFGDLGLERDPEYAAGSELGSLLSAFRPPAAPNAESAFQSFQHAIFVEREGLTYVIDVLVKSRDPEKAARIANAIVDSYIARTAADRSDAASGVTTALAGKIAALQDEVRAAERAVEEFKVAHNIFDDTTGGSLKLQIDQLSGQVIGAQDQLNQLQANYDHALAAGTSPRGLMRLADVSSSPALESLRGDYNARSAALASAQATYGPKHPTVIAAQAELAKVVNLISREAIRIAGELKSDRDLAQANLTKLQSDLATLRQQSGKSDLAMVDLRQLQRRAEASQAILSDFMKRSQETSQIQGLQASQVRVLSSAAPPPDPTWPKPMLLLPVSAMLGFLLGAGVALLLGDTRSKLASRPIPTGPGRARPKVPKPAVSEVAAPKPISGARRLARFDAMRKEIADGASTPTALAVQRILRQVIGRLPTDAKPFILAVRALDDAELAQLAVDLMAGGLEQIGGKGLVISPGEPIVAGRADAYDFIFVAEPHPLAAHADLEILTLGADERRLQGLDEGTLTFPLGDLVESAPPILASNDNPVPNRVAG